MKIRNGFVSNSSTSSFVCVIPKKVYIEHLEKIEDNKEKQLIKLWCKFGKIGKQEFAIFQYLSDQGGMSSTFSPAYNDKLGKFKEYVEEKHDGDFSSVFYGFLDGIKDKLEVVGEL